MPTSRPRYVFDTNTLISAVLFEGSTPGRAFRKALNRGVLLTSQGALDEMSAVLEREKFARYVTVEERTVEEREIFYTALVNRSEIIEPTVNVQECRDPRDDKFLEIAVDGDAAALVSGDKDLLVLHPFRGIPIVTPAEFLRIAGQASQGD